MASGSGALVVRLDRPVGVGLLHMCVDAQRGLDIAVTGQSLMQRVPAVFGMLGYRQSLPNGAGR
jgi:hypothetical protein